MTALLLTSLGDQLDTLFANFDYSVFAFFGSIQSDVLTILAKLFTSFGTVLFSVCFAVLGLIMIFFKRTRKIGLAIVISVIIGTIITNLIVKPVFLRIRPYNTLQSDAAYWSWYVKAGMLSESDYCFPSGHTTAITEICVALLLVHARSKLKGAKCICWIFPILALFVGMSRIYLMLHYATDVIGGYIIGIVSGVAGYLIASLILKKYESRDDVQDILQEHVRPIGILAIFLTTVVMFIFSALYTFHTGGADALRCAYNIDYDCQNEAQQKDKYLGPDGQYYCKIHYTELFGNK